MFGRGLKKHLDSRTWDEFASTFVHSDIPSYSLFALPRSRLRFSSKSRLVVDCSCPFLVAADTCASGPADLAATGIF